MPPARQPALFMPATLYGVAGWPLAQSFSPLLHNTGFQELGIPAAYMRWEIPPDRLCHFVESVRLIDVQGCSITIPHKMALLPMLDSVSEQARLTGSVNTIYRQGKVLCGENTDIAGFLQPLADSPLENMNALILGAGGAAHAAAAALSLRRARRVFAATPSDRSHLPLTERFACTPVLWKDRHDLLTHLVINATPLGMRGKYEKETPFDFTLAGRPADGMPVIAYDIVYNPLETRFLREARLAGRLCVSGLAMFAGQADAQFRLWTGRPLPPLAFDRLRAALGGAIPAEARRQDNTDPPNPTSYSARPVCIS